jgi:hypothetical protein
MGILHAIIGCLIGVLLFKLVSLVLPLEHYGIWSTGILVAFCLIATYGIGYAPKWWGKPVA